VCAENVVIPSHLADITLQGVNGAVIQAVDATQPVILIMGRGITVRGLTVTGGFHGIRASSASSVVLDGNTISGNSDAGIRVRNNSTAQILNNLIENNIGTGVAVNINSAAQIGADSACSPTASPNTIRNNTGDAGVVVQRNSSVRVIGNTITGNRGGGVRVGRGSQAEVTGNDISANAADGISAAHNSTIDISSDGNGCPNPNSTIAPNTGYGASCTGGGFITGRLGTLLGTSGAANVVDCSGGLVP
jgi:parallel beta-helix repeat protein